MIAIYTTDIIGFDCDLDRIPYYHA